MPPPFQRLPGGFLEVASLKSSLMYVGVPGVLRSALTRLDQNRAVNQVAAKAGVGAASVKGVIIWGNHSSTQ